MLAHGPVYAQAQPAPYPTTQPAQKTFSQEELDRLLAPIALYPDALLGQILMASTYPLEVVKAARWTRANPNVTGPALQDAMAAQDWDPSVKALTAVPRVLDEMSENLDWTQSLGDAFLAQQTDVMNTVQALRARAYAAGNLSSGPDLVVRRETQAAQTIYIIESPNPDVVYVPAYNPSVVYGNWWYSSPPYSVYAPGYAYPASGLVFATGIFVGAALWANMNWGWSSHPSHVEVNIHRYNTYNHTSISDNRWYHQPPHRRGVPYRDPYVARQYGHDGKGQPDQGRNPPPPRYDNHQGVPSPSRNRPNQKDGSRDWNNRSPGHGYSNPDSQYPYHPGTQGPNRGKTGPSPSGPSSPGHEQTSPRNPRTEPGGTPYERPRTPRTEPGNTNIDRTPTPRTMPGNTHIDRTPTPRTMPGNTHIDRTPTPRTEPGGTPNERPRNAPSHPGSNRGEPGDLRNSGPGGSRSQIESGNRGWNRAESARPERTSARTSWSGPRAEERQPSHQRPEHSRSERNNDHQRDR
jgi:hypothetical protein